MLTKKELNLLYLILLLVRREKQGVNLFKKWIFRPLSMQIDLQFFFSIQLLKQRTKGNHKIKKNLHAE